MQKIFLLIACMYSIFLYYPIKEYFTGYWLKEWTVRQRHLQIKNKTKL